jgi:hypothetical protein
MLLRKWFNIKVFDGRKMFFSSSWSLLFSTHPHPHPSIWYYDWRPTTTMTQCMTTHDRHKDQETIFKTSWQKTPTTTWWSRGQTNKEKKKWIQENTEQIKKNISKDVFRCFTEPFGIFKSFSAGITVTLSTVTFTTLWYFIAGESWERSLSSWFPGFSSNLTVGEPPCSQ